MGDGMWLDSQRKTIDFDEDGQPFAVKYSHEKWLAGEHDRYLAALEDIARGGDEYGGRADASDLRLIAREALDAS